MIKEPDVFIKDLIARLKPNWKFAFKVSLLIFVITHLFMITNAFQNNDTVKNIYNLVFTSTSGRWFLNAASAPSSFVSLPWIIGLLSFLYLSVTVVVITELFNIRSKTYILLISALLITFPSVAMTFSYIFTADSYFMALALSALAVLITQRYKKGFIAGGVLLAFSMGIYQAYITFAIVLIIAYMLFELLKENTAKKQFFHTLFRFLIMGIISVALYYIILQITLAATGQTLSAYQGLDTIQSVSISFERILTTISNLLTGTFTVFAAMIPKSAAGLYVALLIAAYFIMLVVYFLKIFISKGFDDKAWRIVMLIVLVIALPLGQQFLVVIYPFVNGRFIVQLSASIYFMILPILFDRYPVVSGNNHVLKYSGIAVCLLFCWHTCLTSNIAYINVQQQYEKQYGLCLRIVDRLEQMDDFDIKTPILISGYLPNETYPDYNPSDTYLHSYIDMDGNGFLFISSDYVGFMVNYLNFPMTSVSKDESELIKETPEFHEMDEFPGKNSIKKINGTVVVKVSETREVVESRPVILVRLWDRLTGGLWLD